MKLVISVALIAGIAFWLAPPASAAMPTDSSETIAVGGVARNYLIHVPASYDGVHPTSLVFVFHGGGGEAAGMVRISGMNPVADRHGFIVVYPQGINRQWKDGRTPALSGQDDVTFIAAMLRALESIYRIDPKRVYATGISNGAFFSMRLACDLGDRFAAVAPVAGSIPVGFHDACKNVPVSVMMINGSEDRLVPFDGGRVGGPFVSQGYAIPVPEALSIWTKIDRCPTAPRTASLASADPMDDTTTDIKEFDGCGNGTSVQLYTIAGGGHTWPGGPQFLPPAIVGAVSHDFDGAETIWQFFATHPRS